MSQPSLILIWEKNMRCFGFPRGKLTTDSRVSQDTGFLSVPSVVTAAVALHGNQRR